MINETGTDRTKPIINTLENLFKNKKIDNSLIPEYNALIERNSNFSDIIYYFHSKFFGFESIELPTISIKANLYFPELNQIIQLIYGKKNEDDKKKGIVMSVTYQKPVLLIFLRFENGELKVEEELIDTQMEKI